MRSPGKRCRSNSSSSRNAAPSLDAVIEAYRTLVRQWCALLTMTSKFHEDGLALSFDTSHIPVLKVSRDQLPSLPRIYWSDISSDIPWPNTSTTGYSSGITNLPHTSLPVGFPASIPTIPATKAAATILKRATKSTRQKRSKR